jgi:hypothetical protein
MTTQNEDQSQINRNLPAEVDELAGLQANPFKMLPDDLKRPALGVFVMYQGTIRTPLEITGPLMLWVRDHGLQVADGVKILKSLQSPGCVASVKFPSDLISLLAGKVDDAIRSREREAEMIKRRMQDAEFEAKAKERRAGTDGIISMIGKGKGESPTPPRQDNSASEAAANAWRKQ